MNEALRVARNDVIVVIDGDSELESQALRNLVKPLRDKKVANSVAVSGSFARGTIRTNRT